MVNEFVSEKNMIDALKVLSGDPTPAIRPHEFRLAIKRLIALGYAEEESLIPSITQAGRNWLAGQPKMARKLTRNDVYTALITLGRGGPLEQSLIDRDYACVVSKLGDGCPILLRKGNEFIARIKRDRSARTNKNADKFYGASSIKRAQPESQFDTMPGQLDENKPSIDAIDGHVDLSRDAKPSVVGMSFDDVIKAYGLVTEYRNLREQRFQLKAEMSKLSDELKKLNIKFD